MKKPFHCLIVYAAVADSVKLATPADSRASIALQALAHKMMKKAYPQALRH